MVRSRELVLIRDSKCRSVYLVNSLRTRHHNIAASLRKYARLCFAVSVHLHGTWHIYTMEKVFRNLPYNNLIQYKLYTQMHEDKLILFKIAYAPRIADNAVSLVFFISNKLRITFDLVVIF